jgi:hypothetical protein
MLQLKKVLLFLTLMFNFDVSKCVRCLQQLLEVKGCKLKLVLASSYVHKRIKLFFLQRKNFRNKVVLSLCIETIIYD